MIFYPPYDTVIIMCIQKYLDIIIKCFYIIFTCFTVVPLMYSVLYSLVISRTVVGTRKYKICDFRFIFLQVQKQICSEKSFFMVNRFLSVGVTDTFFNYPKIADFITAFVMCTVLSCSRIFICGEFFTCCQILAVCIIVVCGMRIIAFPVLCPQFRFII